MEVSDTCVCEPLMHVTYILVAEMYCTWPSQTIECIKKMSNSLTSYVVDVAKALASEKEL